MLSGVPKTLPALLRAYEICARAAAVGFDWADAGDVLDKIDEEVRELRDAVRRPGTRIRPRAEEEMGDLLFAIANLARKLGIEPEAALRRANDKFQARFEAMEQLAATEGQAFGRLTLDEQNTLWTRVKAAPADRPSPSQEDA